MTITSEGVIAEIGARLGETPTDMSENLLATAMQVDSDVAENQLQDLSFIGSVPPMERWLGSRSAEQLVEWEHSARMEKYSTVLRILLVWLENDKTGQVQRRIASVQRAIARLRLKLIADTLNSPGTAFNGTAFFSDSHSWGKSGTIDNNLTATAASGTKANADEAISAILAAYEAMIDFKDDHGEPINEDVSRLGVIVPPEQAAGHMEAITSNRIDTGSATRDNPLMGLRASGINFELIASPRLTGAAKMILARLDEGMQPVILAENTNSRKVAAKAEGSDFEFDHDAHAYGVKSVMTAATGLFTSAVLTTYS